MSLIMIGFLWLSVTFGVFVIAAFLVNYAHKGDDSYE
jgi:hypothetical protein